MSRPPRPCQPASPRAPRRLSVLVLVGALLAAPSAPAADRDADVARIDAALRRAAVWLLSRQSDDGAWRSEAYGNMGDGWTLTPLALSALLFTPPDPAIDRAWPRGADFAASLVDAEGRVQPGPHGLSYPVYTAALGAILLSVKANARHARARDALVATLRDRQLTERLGWTPADPSYGGWGYFLGEPRKPAAGEPVHELLSSNLSSTLFAVGALALAGVPEDAPVFAPARAFVARCQAYPDGDGGFFFTPSNDLQNKAGAEPGAPPGRHRSYGTMTADGLRALLRLGVPRSDPRVKAAIGWLSRRFDAEVPPGDFPEDRVWQRDSAWYYWTWSVSHALFRAGVLVLQTPTGPVAWPAPVVEAVLRRQRPDGSWANEATAMREDDPLVATPMAVAALGLARMMWTGEWATSLSEEPAPPPASPTR